MIFFCIFLFFFGASLFFILVSIEDDTRIYNTSAAIEAYIRLVIGVMIMLYPLAAAQSTPLFYYCQSCMGFVELHLLIALCSLTCVCAVQHVSSMR